MTKAYTRDNDKEIAALYLAGEIGKSIAGRFGVSDQTIYRILRGQGISRRPAHRRLGWEDTEGSRRDLVAAYEAGESVRALALRLGTHSGRVMRVLDESGLGWRHPGGRRRFSDEQAAEFARAYLAGESLKQIGQRYDVAGKTIREYLIRAGVQMRPLGAPAFWTEARKAEAARRYQAGEQLKDIAPAMGCSAESAARTLAKIGVHSPRPMPRGENHHSWQGGRFIDDGGYVRVKVPDGDGHLVDERSKGYVLEHRLVMARLLGRRLLKSETVHHVNGNKQDNRPENLQLRQGKHGKGAIFRCAACGSHNIEAVYIPGD